MWKKADQRGEHKMRKELEFLAMIVVQGVDNKVHNVYNKVCNRTTRKTPHKKYIKLWV